MSYSGLIVPHGLPDEFLILLAVVKRMVERVADYLVIMSRSYHEYWRLSRDKLIIAGKTGIITSKSRCIPVDIRANMW